MASSTAMKDPAAARLNTQRWVVEIFVDGVSPCMLHPLGCGGGTVPPPDFQRRRAGFRGSGYIFCGQRILWPAPVVSSVFPAPIDIAESATWTE
jgi:hypothetical protein